MIINEVEISGFKGIRQLTIHPKKINILVGKNNTGKTSILEAIDCTINANELFGMKMKYDPYLPSLINVNEKEAKIVVKSKTEAKYLILSKPELKEALPEFKKQLIERLKSIVSNKENGWDKVEEMIDRILAKEDVLSDVIKRTIKIDSGDDNKMYIFSYTPLIFKEIKPILEFIDKRRVYSKFTIEMLSVWFDNPTLLLSDIKNKKGGEKVISRFIETLLLDNTEAEFFETKKAIVEKIQKYLKERKILENLERFDFDTLLFKNGEKMSEVPYSFMGDGFKSLVGLIAKTSPENKIIFIEEPETHMHPAYMKELMHQIIDFSKENNVQFFITTHSSDILDIVSTDEVEPEYQDYLEKELNIMTLRTFKKDVVIHETNRQQAIEILDDIKLDLRG